MLGFLYPAAAAVQGAQTAHEAEHPWIRGAGFVVLILGAYYLLTRMAGKKS
jgi:hypothetical protein